MAYEIVIPRLGWSMEEGNFVRWLKKDGEHVRRGEALFELEGEKATQEIESVDEGILRIPPTVPQPGDTVVVGKTIGYLVAAGEDNPWLREAAPPLSSHVESISAAQLKVDEGRSPHVNRSSTTIASPRAKRIAKELGVDWTTLSGGGTAGRVRECDVRAAAESTETNGRRIPISKRRRVIAERMVLSRQQTAPVTLTTRADATKLVELRKRMKISAADVPSYQDFIVKLVAKLLKQHPLLAGRWADNAIVLPAENEIHVGIAVDNEDGLLVPVIRDAGTLSLDAIAAESRSLVEAARANRLPATAFQGGVFTVTNLGAFGIDAFTPIINYPETAILGLGAIRREVVILEDLFAVRQQITLSLTFDHRILDGAPAARFLQELVTVIERVDDAI